MVLFAPAIEFPSSPNDITIPPANNHRMTIHHGDLTITWYGYATTKLTTPSGATIYTDPGRYGVLSGGWLSTTKTTNPHHPRYDPLSPNDADIIVVTHDHHYDPDGIHRLANENTTLIAYEGINHQRIANNGRSVPSPDDLPYTVERISYNETITRNDTSITAIPAYNKRDGPWGTTDDGEPLHPRGLGCGYLIALAETTCFWPGDSDVIDEHTDLNVDIFLPSIAKSYTMNRHDAADLATTLTPELVVPIHYNTFPALEANSHAFASDVAAEGIPVALDEHPPSRTP